MEVLYIQNLSGKKKNDVSTWPGRISALKMSIKLMAWGVPKNYLSQMDIVFMRLLMPIFSKKRPNMMHILLRL